MAELTPNPALRLHERLKAWQIVPKGSNPLKHREIEGRDWREVHIETLGWIAEIREHMHHTAQMTGDDDNSDIDSLCNELAQGVLAPNHSLANATPNTAVTFFSDAAIRHLKTIGRNWTTPTVDMSAQNDLLDLAHEAQRLVIESTHLDEEARKYIHQIASHLAKAIGDIQISGPAAIRSLANELSGALILYFADAPAEERAEAQGLLKRLLKDVQDLFRRNVGPKVIEAATTAVIRQILPPAL